MKNILALLIIISWVGVVFAQEKSLSDIDSTFMVDEVDWPAFMANHNMQWDSLPQAWYDGPFLGNGEQGTLMYQLDEQTLHWDVGCSAAHEHRSLEDDDLTEKNFTALNRGRHFIGHLELQLPQEITGSKSHLSLWDAEATGVLNSEGGSVNWKTVVHSTQPVMRFDISAKGNLEGTKLIYIAEEARNPRAVRSKAPRSPVNPSPVISALDDGVQTSVQNLIAGGQTAVAWVQKEIGDTTRLWLSVQHSYPGNEAVTNAVSAVRAATAADQKKWTESHRQWWHNYYPQSFVSVGDRYWDAFYWIQQYKLACATRDKGWIIDNQGPWLQPTAWCASWWNLNVQLSHSGGYVANRRGMVSAMSHQLDVNRDNLAKNVAEPYRHDSYAIGRNSSGWDLAGHAGQPGGREPIEPKIGSEVGNLLWGLHNVDMECSYWQDEQLRDTVLYPLLTRAVNYYRHFLLENEDGLLSLPQTFSPEYKMAVDCTYDLDLLNWGLGRLLEMAEEKGLSEKEEPLIAVWKEIKEKLVPVHVDKETGRMIGKDVKLTNRHRHWSHLLAVYPLRTLTPETEENSELIDRSLTHWHSFGRAMGYSFTGGACMAAILNDGDRALEFLNGLKSFLKPNTFYSEIGLPVMETPLHGATTMQEMLLQSWGKQLRIFPAVPEKWPEVQFHQLRGEGAYLVSARREQGKTQWVFIKSEAGGRVEVEPSIEDAQWLTSEKANVSLNENGTYHLEMLPGEWVMFWPKGMVQPKAYVTPATPHGEEHSFGL